MTGGIDRGPCLLYRRLSYRRKLIRTLWFAAVGLPVLVLVQLEGRLPWALGVFRVPDPEAVGWAWVTAAAVSLIGQAGYTYCRWRMEERGRSTAESVTGVGHGQTQDYR